MKNLAAIILSIFLIDSSIANAQSTINGAYKFIDGKNEHQLFIQDNFLFHTIHQSNEFKMSRGGTFTIAGNVINVQILFNSADGAEVNQKITIPFSLTANSLELNSSLIKAKFDKVDDGKAPLAGVWKITGRMGSDGIVKPIHQTGTRHTYKLLTGSKFQWVAIDPAVKLFSGTGGGSYTFANGKYTEKIEFFSRDNSRVGASLSFDGKLVDGNWHHSGLSSKGDKIHEVWSKVGEK